ncbi:FAD-dependent oxidoreductase [Streptomyces sp. BA2]|uniref:FAD-dependent oxidoreductase n=1 Tax=Streptomyces sp. BA2 TaxID=436595 RepID=UPI00132AD63F|nr:FAD-dependent oxidoreductase [Streptomyces sp. BA2]MWA15140.1 NAD(P)-binding protein [Streptomyces sp. BA2]
MRRQRSVDVLVVGGGPAGLAAAARLAASGAGTVEVLEREARAGGVPHHCHHGGFGRWGVTGPQYAERLVEDALGAGAAVRTGVSATGWAGPLSLDTTGPHGLERITARALILATGARERPRTARLVPGSRPAGVFTTGELQQAVNIYRQEIGTRAVVVGAEPVSYAALSALRRAGVEVAALVTEEKRPQVGRCRAAAARLGVPSVPLVTGAVVAELMGRGRLSGVRLRRGDGRDGRECVLACDTVVFTGDFVPDHELARRGGVLLDAGTRGPAVDGSFRTASPGVFAVGSGVHAVVPARVAAGEGVRVARAVRGHLEGVGWPCGAVPVVVGAPLRWVAPNLLSPGAPGSRFVLRTAKALVCPVLVVSQDGRCLYRQRVLGKVLPNRGLYFSGSWVGKVDAGGGPVRVALG